MGLKRVRHQERLPKIHVLTHLIPLMGRGQFLGCDYEVKFLRVPEDGETRSDAYRSRNEVAVQIINEADDLCRFILRGPVYGVHCGC